MPRGATQELIGLKVEIFQLGAKIAPLKTRRCKRVALIALPQTRRPEKISRLSQPHCTLTCHGIQSREKIASLLV